MDDRGGLAQSLNRFARRRAARAGWPVACAQPAKASCSTDQPSASAKIVDRWLSLRVRMPRGIGITGVALVLAASIAYGVVKGDHVPAIVNAFKDARDRIANAAGFRIVSIALTGNHHVSREEVLAIAGITGTTSLPFVDVELARERLKSNPWIGDASLLKLYPGELQIVIKEREAFALWQQARRVTVIADDGTVLEPYVAPRLVQLPLVVGAGAQTKAKAFLALLDRYPALRDYVSASILVGERRWNLRLKNGIDVQLPESNVAAALERLVALDREKNLLTRDIVAIDLRIAERLTIRLSDAATQARLDALKEKSKKKGGSA
jgi:cell division protein FtsQ